MVDVDGEKASEYVIVAIRLIRAVAAILAIFELEFRFSFKTYFGGSRNEAPQGSG